MQFLQRLIENFIKEHVRRKRLYRVVSVLACIVVFVTTYAMILPAITLDRATAEEQPGIEVEAGSDPALSGEVNDGTDAEDPEPAEPPEESVNPADPEPAGGGDSGQTGGEDADLTEGSSGQGGEDADLTDDSGQEGAGAEMSTGDGAQTDGTGDTASTSATENSKEGLTEAEAETASQIELITEDTQLVFEGEDYYVYADFGMSAKLPVGVKLEVKEITKEKDPEVYEEYYTKALSEMQDKYDEKTKLSFARFYDIAFMYEGREIEPAGDVKVRIEYKKALEVPKETTVDAIHFEDVKDAQEEEKRAKVLELEIEAKENEAKDSEVEAIEFKSEQFSVYGVVGTESITTTILTADGSTYEITVSFDPQTVTESDAKLLVRELTQEDGEYESLVEQTASMIDSDKDALKYIKLLDISITDENDQKIALSGPVDVQIKLLDREELGENTRIVHFAEDAEGSVTEPEVLDGTIEGDTVRFETTGFSAYAIVDGPDPVPTGWHKVESVDELIERSSGGLYIGHTGGYYFGNTLVTTTNPTRTGIFKTKPEQSYPASDAAKYYFERVEGTTNQVYAYCYGPDGVTKQYVYNGNNNSLSFTTEENKTAFTVTVNNGVFNFNNGKWFWNMQGDTSGTRFCSYDKSGDKNNNMYVWYHTDVPEDPFDLDGTSFGLMNWNGGAAGKALMGSQTGNNLDAKSLATMRTTNDSKHLFVPNDSEISMWTFHWIEDDKFHLTTVVDGSMKYLRIAGDGLSIVSEPDDNCKIQVVPGDGTRKGQICLKSGNATLTYSGDLKEGFTVNGSAGSEWLYLVDLSELTSQYFLTYTAEKVSVSDPAVTTGEQVIVYTRAWNEETLKYDYYAISSDGKVVPVYENGNMIEWVSGQINTLLWNFVEYNDEVTGLPNYYYELYNQYSEKYIAPQVTDGQILSDETIGINMSGRQGGRYYSPIVAWDDDNYAYAGLKVENGQIVSCPISEAMDFYFAIPQKLNVDDTLHVVDTVNNNDFGITMRIIDKGSREEMSAVLGSNEGREGMNLVQGLLKTKLENNGYPITKANRSLSEIYGGDQVVNHLFIQSVYDESGYFEFDSTQNFASLKGKLSGDFTVYRELGTHERNTKTNKHGQFFPFNDLKAGTFSSVNPKNLYTFDETDYQKPLPDSDPRKYENLYTIQHGGDTPNYYFAMETEASFTQTPSGLDDWGHDIIFEFTGDDDFWLYVDGELVIDLGGIHSSVPGSVNFRTGDVRVNGVSTTLKELFYNNFIARGGSQADAQAYVDGIFIERIVDGRPCFVFDDYSTHTMKAFYMERGAGASNLRMRFNLASVKKKTVELTKKLTGPEDSVMAEFPYQISYKDAAGVSHNLNNDEMNYVTYKGSIKPVKYKDSQVIGGITYKDVFFLKPGEAAEITFPDGMTEYKIVECGVNTDVFQRVSVNEREIQGSSGTGYEPNRKDFGIDYATTDNRPKVNYDNEVNPNALQTLTIQKQLYREDGESRIYYRENPDVAFDFTLYLAGEFDNIDKSNADMQTYYVKDPGLNYCRWNKDTKKFESLGTTNFNELTEEEKKAAAFTTSIYGAISKIPVDHTIEVRNILAGTKFKTVEPPAKIPDGYSFQRYELNGQAATTPAAQGVWGTISTETNSEVVVRNLKGYGLRMNKTWSDAEYMAEREPTYFAVYVENSGEPVLVEGSVRQLPYTAKPQTLYWYFQTLIPGTYLDQYVIREVRISGGTPVVDDEGVVTNADDLTIEPLPHGAEFSLNGKQKGETEESPFEYTVLYENLEQKDNVRVQEVTDNRPGIILKKMQWDGTTPLAGAEFTLEDNNGNLIGTFNSDEDGLISVAFLRDNVPYTLTETGTPQGWYGLQAPLIITLNEGSIRVDGSGQEEYYIIDNQSATPSLTVKDRPYSFQAVKKDADTLQPLKDVKFALHKQVEVGGVITIDLNPMPGYENLSTDANGLIPQIDNTLPPGTYELREKTALRSYDPLSGYIRFTVGETGSITLVGTDQQPIPEEVTLDGPTEEEGGSLSYEMTIVNHRYASVTLRKTDNNSTALAGAKFELCKFDKTWVKVPGYEEIDMADVSQVVLEKLPIGRYRLTELNPPDGYLILDDYVYFNVSFDNRGNVRIVLTDETGTGPNSNPYASLSGTTISVKNTPGQELPSTGGIGTTIFYVAGAVLAVGAAVLLIARRRAAALFLCLALVVALSAPIGAAAEEVREFPDLDKTGSITATFTYYDKDSGNTLPVAGGNSVGLYKVADVKVDNGFIFVVDPRFASAGEIPATSEELDSVNIELAGKMAKIAADYDFDIAPVEMDSDGTASFSDLEVGLYLVMQAKQGTGESNFVIAPFLVSIPYRNPDGSLTYDVNAQTKPIGIAWIPPESPDEPDKPKKLPQTGQLWWPVLALGAAGAAFIIAGVAAKRR